MTSGRRNSFAVAVYPRKGEEGGGGVREHGQQTLLPEEAELLRCEQQDAGDVLPVCCGQSSFLLCSPLPETLTDSMN